MEVLRLQGFNGHTSSVIAMILHNQKNSSLKHSIHRSDLHLEHQVVPKWPDLIGDIDKMITHHG